ncbi:helix-turn-helix domain-containing protein [Nocardia sp. NPDC056000]|uniref:helix-turn-helix domain-containing protein n=1 Tax=Nocardia sp. NPDC056000 TaxID=3345674 RepID=UPI0035D93355
MAAHNPLGEFLRSRRARITPEQVGLRAGASGRTRRRVAGLRREELAQLAGISVEYYQRLEQGRANHPSNEVLDALAEVLRLDATERGYLGRLANPARNQLPRITSAEVRPQLRSMLDLVDKVPALVITDRFDVLAANTLAGRLFEPISNVLRDNGNLARTLFLETAARDFYVEWDEVAAATVAALRLTAGDHPEDLELTALLDELSTGSAEFTELWSAGEVAVRTHGSKNFRHPTVGVLTLNYENLELPGDLRQRLVTFSPDPATATDAALRVLGSQTYVSR